MYNIYYLNFNSRFNRKVKRYDIIESYQNYILGSSQKENFKWNDEIKTTITANIDTIPNYCIVCDENNIIVSRWFVIDGKYQRLNQYELILERDVMADEYYQILSMPIYLKKATITSTNDPSIYIRDGNFNQIKKKEIALTDSTQSPWVVGYIARDFSEADIQASFPTTTEATFEVASINNWEHYNKEYRTDVGVTTQFTLNLQLDNDYAADYKAKATYIFTYETLKQKSEQKINEFVPGYIYRYSTSPNVADLLRNIRGSNYYQNFIENYVEGLYPITNLSVLAGIDGKIIKDTSTDIYYRINVDYSYGGSNFLIDPSAEIQGYLNSNIAQPQAAGSSLSGTPASDTWKLSVTTRSAKVNLEQIFDSINVSINPDRYHLEDAPYDMFCIPLANLEVRYGSVTDLFVTKKEVAIAAATAISTKLGAACYDIQLLPYFPCQEILRESDTNLRVTRGKYQLITNAGGEPVSVLIWARKANFNVLLNRGTYRVNPQAKAINKKVKYETEMYRLCSPNYAAAFDFNPHANNGVPYYEASCSYRPFQPYIHVNPHFNEDGLYGGNYNDARGLVCSGDFSLAQVSDAWVNYELQNKNYQQIFDRQIQTLELQQKVGRTQDYAKLAAGTIQGTVSGAMGGSMLGGGVGTAIGGAAGGALSLAGGIADININEQLRRDQLSAAHTYQELNLANIKAIPDTITKITAYNQQNKIFPFVEIYSATEEEIKYFRSQLKYNGMSINRIGTISEFISTSTSDEEEAQFIQGSIIRVPDSMDAHLAAFIAEKLENGIYLV